MNDIRPLSDEILRQQMLDLGRRARAAAATLARAETTAKNAALLAAARAMHAARADILAANAQDLASARDAGLTGPLIDRLALNDKRIDGVAASLEEIATLPDPIGSTIESWTRPNGLKIEKVRVPLGVVGIIYESRPNVTADAGALCLKSGNAAILRGGSEAVHSNRAIHAALQKGIASAGLPADAIQLVPTTDRRAVGLMLAEMTEFIDVLVPRGGKSLVARVQKEARVPVIGHLEGLCHVYIDKGADLEMAKRIVVNAKMRRTGICGAAETLLVDRACAPTHLKPLVTALIEAGCEVRGDEATRQVDARVKRATEEDWRTEYLDAIISARVVDGVAGAAQHIETYGSHHTEAIVTQDQAAADTFFRLIDSAILLHNASTQFADGGEFGMGAEIGISTSKIHARGPVGARELTSWKFQVRGTGQTRP